MKPHGLRKLIFSFQGRKEVTLRPCISSDKNDGSTALSIEAEAEIPSINDGRASTASLRTQKDECNDPVALGHVDQTATEPLKMVCVAKPGGEIISPDDCSDEKNLDAYRWQRR